jgi:hypothetical protein
METIELEQLHGIDIALHRFLDPAYIYSPIARPTDPTSTLPKPFLNPVMPPYRFLTLTERSYNSQTPCKISDWIRATASGIFLRLHLISYPSFYCAASACFTTWL